MIRALLILLLTTVLTIASAYAQDVEQLAKADPLSVSGGLTASGIYINLLQGRSLAFSNDVGQSLRRTRVDNWDELKDLVDGSETELWKLNKQFIDEQFSQRKDFYFSHNPWNFPDEKFRTKEVEYIIELGASDIIEIGNNTWKVVW